MKDKGLLFTALALLILAVGIAEFVVWRLYSVLIRVFQ